jgi:hypothetical protein
MPILRLSKSEMRTDSSSNCVPLGQALILSLMLLMANSGRAQNWTPDAAIISKVESDIKPSDIPLEYPTGHPPIIGHYARYYFGYIGANNHRMISGELVLPWSKMKAAGIYVVGSQREFPRISDGGCAVMHVVYDVEAGHMVSLQCNGLA